MVGTMITGFQAEQWGISPGKLRLDYYSTLGIGIKQPFPQTVQWRQKGFTQVIQSRKLAVIVLPTLAAECGFTLALAFSKGFLRLLHRLTAGRTPAKVISFFQEHLWWLSLPVLF